MPALSIAEPILEIMKKFNCVVESCYSYELNPFLHEVMEEFKRSVYLLKSHLAKFDVKSSISWKLHIVLFHVKPFCIQRECGLGKYAEQAIESLHAKFKSTWSRYNWVAVHKSHGNALKRAVVSFSAARR